MNDFATWCQTAQECIPASPFHDRLTELHNAMLARIAELEEENERLRADVTALLTGDFNDEDWARLVHRLLRTDRQKQVIEALDTAIRGMHAKLNITSSEAVAALTAVAYHVAMAQAAQYYEIEAPMPEGQP